MQRHNDERETVMVSRRCTQMEATDDASRERKEEKKKYVTVFIFFFVASVSAFHDWQIAASTEGKTSNTEDFKKKGEKKGQRIGGRREEEKREKKKNIKRQGRMG